MKKYLFAAIILTAVLPLRAHDESVCKGGYVIDKINITTTRVHPSVVRDRMPVKEGERLDCEEYRKACEYLHDMKIFKKLSITVDYKENNQADINISGEDSYYIIPFPFITGGDSNLIMLMLLEVNLFKRGEAVMLAGAHSDDGNMGAAALMFANTSITAAYTDADYKEKVYSNGSYTTGGVFGSSDTKDKWGAPVEERKREERKMMLMASKTIKNHLTLGAGVSNESTKYNGFDAEQNKIYFQASVHNNMRSSRGMAGNAGAIFGLGLSDLDDSLKKLPAPRFGYSAGLAYTTAGGFTASDDDYNMGKLSLLGSMETPSRHMLILSANAAAADAKGYDKLSTTGDLISSFGSYGREYRGDYGLGGGASFIFYIIRNRLGTLSVAPFAETSTVFDGGHSYSQTGVGTSAGYKFWRFPFAFGFTYTRNLQDNTNQFSFSAGAGF
ncbi:hypothetical protein Dip518_000654 [Parelusimicrobium proximum]|uniref:POTRA domain-containing protein n=1 Tax=Parelusimicrobium proximum TaxID=3228953 RepID=UPI003D170DD7